MPHRPEAAADPSTVSVSAAADSSSAPASAAAAPSGDASAMAAMTSGQSTPPSPSSAAAKAKARSGSDALLSLAAAASGPSQREGRNPSPSPSALLTKRSRSGDKPGLVAATPNPKQPPTSAARPDPPTKAMITPSPASNPSAATRSVGSLPAARQLHPYGAPPHRPSTPPSASAAASPAGPPRLSLYGTSKLTTSPIRVKNGDKPTPEDGKAAAAGASVANTDTDMLQKLREAAMANADLDQPQMQSSPAAAAAAKQIDAAAPPSIRRMTHPTHLHYAPTWRDSHMMYSHPGAPLSYYGRLPPPHPHHYAHALPAGAHPAIPAHAHAHAHTHALAAAAGEKRASPPPQAEAASTELRPAKKARVVSQSEVDDNNDDNDDNAKDNNDNTDGDVDNDAEENNNNNENEEGEESSAVAEEPAVAGAAGIADPTQAKLDHPYASAVAHHSMQYGVHGHPPPTMHHAVHPHHPSAHLAHASQHHPHHPHYMYAAYPYPTIAAASAAAPYRGAYGHHMPHFMHHPHAAVPLTHAHGYYHPASSVAMSHAPVMAMAAAVPPPASSPAADAESESDTESHQSSAAAAASNKTDAPGATLKTDAPGITLGSTPRGYKLPTAAASVKRSAQPPHAENDTSALQKFASVSEWQRISNECGDGRTPSLNRCVPLKEPIPSKFWGEAAATKEINLPDFHRLVNFPDYLAKPRHAPRQGNKLTTPEGKKLCVMCGKLRVCSAASLVHKNKAKSGIQSAPKDEADCSGHIIPRQNKGLCTACDVTVWVIAEHNLEIKWCKGCKNFRPWAAFGEKGSATKCVRCRQRQREKYAMSKGDSRVKRYIKVASPTAATAATKHDKKSARGNDAAKSGIVEEHLAAVTGLQSLRKATTA
eukprot:CAMPEP_0119569102 /NCGR_PEP_ID=MMETSP1352-20130426/40696_1 /TAXON_ID=265584 /ORGANISM="Stauroneis constricta, Strain CCMP1120" /LENGTH=878 /DNA_ID=CAMNT_0007618609 /DNA_START=46 /DNA_END=2682 /DNA_ORIENTATION=+